MSCHILDARIYHMILSRNNVGQCAGNINIVDRFASAPLNSNVLLNDSTEVFYFAGHDLPLSKRQSRVQSLLVTRHGVERFQISCAGEQFLWGQPLVTATARATKFFLGKGKMIARHSLPQSEPFSWAFVSNCRRRRRQQDPLTSNQSVWLPSHLRAVSADAERSVAREMVLNISGNC
jgi:hypothetical protein